MKNWIVLFFVLIGINTYNSQNITFIYELNYKPSQIKSTKTTEEFYLDVLGKQSVFRSYNDRKSDSLVEKTSFGANNYVVFGKQFYVKKNLSKPEIIKIINTPLMNDVFFIKIEDQLTWKIHSERKIISDYTCQKATADYGGRKWTAWFTEKIPLQEGPYIFNGLPGLIIKIADEVSDFDFTLVQVKKSNQNNSFAQRTGKQITWKLFQQLQLNFFNEPYAQIKARGLKFQIGDKNGNSIETSMKQLTEDIQRQTKDNDNPIELAYKVEYP